MALKIITASEPIHIDRLNLVIYSAPGTGKTSLAFTAECPLLLDFDRGAHRACIRGDSVRCERWDDAANMTAEDLAPYATIVIDTAGRALDALTADIIERGQDPKARAGSLTIQGYGVLKGKFTAWLRSVNTMGKDVILIAHMDEQRRGDDVIERLDVQGGSKGEIYKAADAMGRIAIRDGKYWLLFSPTDAAFGKNPGQLEPLVIPRPDKDPQFLAKVIQQIKDKLNTLSEEQAKAQEELEAWRVVIEAMKDADDFNDKLAGVKKAPKAAQALFAKTASERGLVYDKAAAKYAAAPPTAFEDHFQSQQEV